MIWDTDEYEDPKYAYAGIFTAFFGLLLLHSGAKIINEKYIEPTDKKNKVSEKNKEKTVDATEKNNLSSYNNTILAFVALSEERIDLETFSNTIENSNIKQLQVLKKYLEEVTNKADLNIKMKKIIVEASKIINNRLTVPSSMIKSKNVKGIYEIAKISVAMDSIAKTERS